MSERTRRGGKSAGYGLCIEHMGEKEGLAVSAVFWSGCATVAAALVMTVVTVVHEVRKPAPAPESIPVPAMPAGR